MEMILKAIEFATKAHEGQRRKSKDIDYISHPFSVGMLLKNYGFSDEVVAAGILHDVVEDSDFTIEDLEKVFGAEISTIVGYVSEKEKDIPWEQRKIDYIHTIKFEANDEARFVCCADKVHNLSKMEEQMQTTDDPWKMFKRGKLPQKWFYLSVYNGLKENIDKNHPLMKELERLVNVIFVDDSEIDVIKDFDKVCASIEKYSIEDEREKIVFQKYRNHTGNISVVAYELGLKPSDVTRLLKRTYFSSLFI